MKRYRVIFQPMGISREMPEGITLLEAEIKAGIRPDAPCGGKGTCGKCLVNMIKDGVKEEVKACQVILDRDMEVEVSAGAYSQILVQGTSRSIALDPVVRSAWIDVEKCVIGDNRSDWTRFKESLAKEAGVDEAVILPNLPLAAGLYELLQANKFRCFVIYCQNAFGQVEVLDIRADETPVYSVALDIGTTSVVTYLLDGHSGEQLAVASVLNPQSQFGADVIQRSNHVIEQGGEEMAQVIRGAVDQLVGEICEKAGVAREDVYLIAGVGNTCMHHLFMQISPSALVHSPYNPSFSDPLIFPAGEIGLSIHPNGRLMFLSNIAGFVGADTVGVMLAVDFDKRKPLTLAIDIGTNGEMVLGNEERMIACSTAAGPAFEGAKIECGMRAAPGAVDHFMFEGTEMKLSVVGDRRPVGICGSGLMDVVASLLEVGLIDDTGRLQTEDEVETDCAKANVHRVVNLDGNVVFMLAFENESEDGRPVYLSQKDIREVQLAKGAIAAGIELMADTLGRKISEIEQVFIAGAFGNYMRPASACRLGMIPMELLPRIDSVGNAAGEGAKIAALNREEFEHSVVMARKCEFLELATHPDFQDTYVDNLMFE